MRVFKNQFIVKATSVIFILFLMLTISLMSLSKLPNQVQADENVTFTEFPVTNIDYTYDITTGPDGNLWFTEVNSGGNSIGKITPTGTVTEFPMPADGSYPPTEITNGPDSNLWFTDERSNFIGRITPTGTVTEFPLPTNDINYPFDITTGSDGNLWFTENGSNKIGRITPTGTITEFPIPANEPLDIISGPDGNLWFTSESNEIGRITPTGTITEFPLSTTDSYSYGITKGPDGNLWFTEDSFSPAVQPTNYIGRITPAGIITMFSIPTSGSQPIGITTGQDGNLWFTEWGSNNIGSITPAGTITEFPIPTSASEPTYITNGSDGNLWFAEENTTNIGRITLSGVSPTPSPTPIPTPTTISGTIQDSNKNLVRNTNISVTCNTQALSTTTTNIGTFKLTFKFGCPVGNTVTVTVNLGVPYKTGTTETGSGVVKKGGSIGNIKLSLPIPPPANVQDALNWALTQVGHPTGPVKLWEGIDTALAWNLQCLSFVQDAWFEAGVTLGNTNSTTTALSYWKSLLKTNPNNFPIHLACPTAQTTGDCTKSSYSNTPPPPLGALVFWGNNKYVADGGHVAISLGNDLSTTANNEVVSTPAYPYYSPVYPYYSLKGIFDPRVFEFPLKARDASTYNYLGWMMP
jgi:streptogramin lyase/cell wall-associated NlpC family hydrolase